MMTNPSHILIARSSRGTHNPSASLSSPTETHAAAAGIFRSTGSPPWFLEGCDTDDLISELSIDDSEDPIDVDKTFTKRHEFPGTVKIVVESTTFWAHKEVLYFASPFFQAALSGDWAETGRPASMSSVITISQPPIVLGDKRRSDAPTEMTFAPMDPDIDPEELDIDLGESSDAEASDSSQAILITQDDERPNVEMSAEPKKNPGTMKERGNRASATKVVGATEAAVRRRQKVNGPDAVIVLKEEKASTFHDFLHFVYPGMECTITWNNVEGLMNIAHKLCVPSLQRKCLNFLLTHAAGRPIKAMRIAELFEEEELYRESSRFVLDNPGGWSEHELSTLSSETLLRLERRRTWFLERVLKLGLIQIAKEYECCSSCSDPASCARLLEEKWRQAYQAVFRFGPCQPSMVFRYLRTLEGISPPLALSHLACQSTAKAFIATLFDRMFTLGVAAVAGVAGPRRHFLYCSLRPENPAPRPPRNRDAT
ncbi:hypothetical protein HETIRDRAFT_33355 [Heterobasidion irregulare TC 32-1]|uniref:BTB domain-containing protein n=1 Tax=Heterobasidion irregulare (strain TC 32-1) TaxID=747525 RepID=W4K412_HETIT|nr:uncharacterized protein HETIRDRAFT_33355 [Heterobasidion irregulare TC 32-1]ETW80484.1 hypothetical protein HETIRDRAFT_33355 [Heterobasidion irregulare TC 32-1]